MRAKRQPSGQKTAEFLATHPVFTVSEARAAFAPATKGPAALERLKYHLRRGRLKTVVRGVYATVPPGVDAGRYRPDRYLVAASVRPDAVFSHHSALELLGAGHSDWSVCTVLTGHRRAAFESGGVTFQFLLAPPPLRGGRNRGLGLRQVDRAGRMLSVTGPERTLLDGFRQPRLVGGLPELVESAMGFPVLDLALLERLLAVYDQRHLYGAAGWFLEQGRERFAVPDRLLARLEKLRPRSPQHLPRGGRRGGRLVARWNLILPEAVVSRREVG
jgi:predicted transcriptional regulator of viral defense system